MCLREEGTPQNKNHAQDGGMLRVLPRQHPAILPWFLVLGWRPSFRISHGHLARFVQRAGLLLDVVLERDPFGKPFPAFRILLEDTTASAACPCASPGSKSLTKLSIDHAKTRAKRRARTSAKAQRRMLCFSISAR